MEPHLVTGEDGRSRCWWGASTPDYTAYHDVEWGRPVDDDATLFEKLCLEGFQSGLSWLTILRKRDDFRRVFHDFDHRRVAQMDDSDVERLLQDASIVRHRKKIESTINNARRACEVEDEHGSLGAFFWSFEPATPSAALVSQTAESAAMAKELKRRGFTFVGPTTVHAFMQAMGMVNDHLEGCFAHDEVETLRRDFTRPT